MQSIIVRNGLLINEGQKLEADLLIKKGRIHKIASSIDESADIELDASGQWVMPGIIDDQVHFREPGLTHKADLYTEPRAAVAGGVTSFMEMPNTNPPALSQALLADKYAIAARSSLANYSFFMGASNDNLDQVLRTDPETVCGIKAFMGSSTGNMLVDDPDTLNRLFANSHMLIATHCEDEGTIRRNLAKEKAHYGEDIPIELHPTIRSAEACYLSSSLAVELAKKYHTRLHILHISTANELSLFTNELPLKEKRITSEVCVHHLFFNSDQYKTLGTRIKCNPAIKSAAHQQALWPALLDNRLDIIATDHAPHSQEEKQQVYTKAPSGLPLVQHSLNIMLRFRQQGRISMERIVEKMCHAPAECFRIRERGYLREGYWADVVIVHPDQQWELDRAGIHYKCGWSPLEGEQFEGKVRSTIVSGHLAYHEEQFFEGKKGERLMFKSL